MGYPVYLYEWPESQECLDCEHSSNLSLDPTTGSEHTVCHLNHDKTKEDNCSCFTLPEEEEEA